MATTTNYSIFYPVATDNIAPLHTAFSTLATSVDTALSNSSTGLTGINNHLQNYQYTVANDSLRAAITGMTAGSRCYVTGTKATWVYNGTAWKLVAQEWSTYTPTAITGFAFNTSRYMVSDGIVTVQIKATKNSTTATATTFDISLPLTGAAILDSRAPIGQGTFVKVTASNAMYPLVVNETSTTNARALYSYSTPVKLSNVNPAGTTAPAAIANTDYIVMNFSYELA
jgi:hypothetical protein